MNKKFMRFVSGLMLVIFWHGTVHAATTDLATAPLVTSSTTSVRPNLMFLLDDSGSMDWDFLPDWASGASNELFYNNGYNGVAYNAAVTYAVPTYYNADGTSNTTTYLSQTGANTRGSCGADWCAVKQDGYGVQSTATTNLVGNAFFYTFVAGEYCDSPNLRNCATQASPTTARPFPATLRWCTTSALTTCQAVRIDSGSTTYTFARTPRGSSATISVSGTNSTSVTGITVSGKQIMSAVTTATTSSSTQATSIRDAINACTSAVTGLCDISGYSATRSGSTVTITAPVGTVITVTPVVTKNSGTMTVTPSAFSGGVPGNNILTNIVAATTSYPFPGTATKSSTRTDCAGTTCTYAEEMTNYANWYAYYRTRMQMMKTSASQAFANVGTNFRVGYASINNNTGTDFLNPAPFTTSQKRSWYDKFFAAIPNNSTPLRQALAKVGRLYAGKFNGTNYNGVAAVDPLQYSCQQNFTILSTDGYWNDSSGFVRLDGSTSVGQQDGVEPRPFNDGAVATQTTNTPTTTTVRRRTVQPQTVTTPWSRTVTTVSATMNCSTGAASGGGSCITDSTSGTRTWCFYTNNNPTDTSNNSCNLAGTGGIWACRVSGGGTIASSGGTGCRADSSGVTWCVYPNNSTAGTSSCSQLKLSGTNQSGAFMCKAPTTTDGYTVTTQPQTYNQVQTGSRTTDDDVATTVTVSVVTINGVPQPSTSSTGTPVVTNVSTSFSAATDTGAPTGSTTWTNGTASTSCSATPPSASTGSATSGTVTTTNTGTATVTNPNPPAPVVVVGTATVTNSSTGGTSDTLADVAEYYYVTDLRDSSQSNCTGAVVPPATVGNDVCANNVPVSGLDAASWQHMTTFTLGLGASGYMQFTPTYSTATSGDYFDVKNGTVANPASGVCSWQASGACNWPVPAANDQTTIDDLWHAAVNGRGTYFSATNPATLSAGLNSALAGASARTGASAAATTSNPNVTSGDNFVFSSTFTTQEWTGELIRQQLDLVTGQVSATVDWAAQAQLDAQTTRNIYTLDTAATNGLRDFTYANLTATEKAYFSTPAINSLSQFCASGVTCLTSADQTAASGTKLVDYLRGDRTNEGISTDTTKYYRARAHRLGDIVNAEAVYVKQPLFNYADTGYSAYITAQSSRQGMVYVASNDGMMHAFNASTGAETWAYVPTMLFPNLYKLADKNYTANHQYFADGTPTVGDIYTGGAWKTLLVAGLNGGGRGYYALDVTVPGTPKALWEFTDTNMGYTYGNPVITKLADGTWVVLVTSGYNNVSPGDGVGRLYVLNAATGALIRTISTGVGGTVTPSGLSRISAWVDNGMSDNTAVRAYGGDLLGNVWRFDINNTIGAAGYDAHRLTTLYTTSAGTVPQPITAKPELGEVSGYPVVFVGTGRYLGVTDLTDTTVQSFYAIKDNLDTTSLANPKGTGTTFVQQTMTITTCPSGTSTTICNTGQIVRTATANAVNFAVNNGWYVNLPDSGERANTDPTLALGTLGFTTNVPNSSACTAGGTSFRYLLDYRTGSFVSTSTTGVGAVILGNALATRGVFVRLPNNTVVQLTRLSDGTTVTTNVPIGAGAGPTRRVSWRELVNDQ